MNGELLELLLLAGRPHFLRGGTIGSTGVGTSLHSFDGPCLHGRMGAHSLDLCILYQYCMSLLMAQAIRFEGEGQRTL